MVFTLSKGSYWVLTSRRMKGTDHEANPQQVILLAQGRRLGGSAGFD